MQSTTIVHREKIVVAGRHIFLLILLAFLVLPSFVSGGTTGTADITGNVLHVPVAQFAANVTEGISPLAVQFFDRSDLDATSWSWDFGDGTQSMIQNPIHTYTSGMYTVNLTVSNSAGNSTMVAKNYITASPVQVPPSQPLSPVFGNGDGGSGSGNGFPVPARANPPARVQAPGGRLPGGVQLAPVQVSQTQTIDLSSISRFMYTDSFCRPYAVIGREDAGRTGSVINVSGKMVQIIRPEFTLIITAESITESDGIIRAENIRSLRVVSVPLEADTKGLGRVTSSYTATLGSWPQDAWLSGTIEEPVNPGVTETFRRAVEHNGNAMRDIAYTLTIQKNNSTATVCSSSNSSGVFTLTVQKTNITAIRTATITMSVATEWVSAHGGIDSIVIGRIGEDQTCTILKTSYAGSDRNGNREFIAESPEGLSVFGLIATTAALPDPGFMQNIFGNNGWLGSAILVIFIIGLILGYGIWRARRKNQP